MANIHSDTRRATLQTETQPLDGGNDLEPCGDLI